MFLTRTIQGPGQFSHHNFYNQANTKPEHLVKQGRFRSHKDPKVNQQFLAMKNNNGTCMFKITIVNSLLKAIRVKRKVAQTTFITLSRVADYRAQMKSIVL